MWWNHAASNRGHGRRISTFCRETSFHRDCRPYFLILQRSTSGMLVWSEYILVNFALLERSQLRVRCLGRYTGGLWLFLAAKKFRHCHSRHNRHPILLCLFVPCHRFPLEFLLSQQISFRNFLGVLLSNTRPGREILATSALTIQSTISSVLVAFAILFQTERSPAFAAKLVHPGLPQSFECFWITAQDNLTGVFNGSAIMRRILTRVAFTCWSAGCGRSKTLAVQLEASAEKENDMEC